MKFIYRNLVFVIILNCIHFYALSQIKLEILTKNIEIRRLTKVISLDVKITYTKTNNVDTLILYHNEADELNYSSYIYDNFFQLKLNIGDIRNWTIPFMDVYPHIPRDFNCLPKTRKIIVLSDTSVIYSLKFDANMLRKFIRGSDYKKGFNVYLSYDVDWYKDYFISLNKNNTCVNYFVGDEYTSKKGVKHYSNDLISNNTVNIKYQYRHLCFFHVWIRNLLPPHLRKNDDCISSPC